jgi:hypothetical protein
MNEKKPKYLVYNVTRKPPRLCEKTGRDLRTLSEKVGHGVSFRDSKGTSYIIVAGGQPRMIDELTPGIIALATGTAPSIRVKKIDDVMEALQDHTLASQAAPKPRAFPSGAPELGVAALSKGLATEMGKDTHEQRGGSEHEGAINPSGDPNFLVRAPAGAQHGRRSAKQKEAGAVSLE